MTLTLCSLRIMSSRHHIFRAVVLHAIVLCTLSPKLVHSSTAATPLERARLPQSPASSGEQSTASSGMLQRGDHRRKQQLQHLAWARAEKARMHSHLLLTDLHSLNSDIPNITARPQFSSAQAATSSGVNTTSSPTARASGGEHRSRTTQAEESQRLRARAAALREQAKLSSYLRSLLTAAPAVLTASVESVTASAHPRHLPPPPYTSPNGRTTIPLEAGPVEAVMIAMDDTDSLLPRSQRPVLAMWRAIIRSAQRQAISVIVYVVLKDGRSLQQSTATIVALLREDADIDVDKVLFVEGYGSDSVWMRDFGPIFFMAAKSELRLVSRLKSNSSSSDSASSRSSGTSRHSSGDISVGKRSGEDDASASAMLRRLLSQDSTAEAVNSVSGALQGVRKSDPADIPIMQPSILDIRYYSDRPADDALPIDFGKRTSLPVFGSELLFEGGNLISDGRGLCIMSDRVLYVAYRGTNLTLAERKAALSVSLQPYGCESLIIVEALNYDITGHVDMWLSFLDPTTLLMGMYTRDQNPLDHLLLHHNAALLRSKGLDIIIAPMPTHCPEGRYSSITGGTSRRAESGGKSGDQHSLGATDRQARTSRRALSAPQTCPDLEWTGEDPITRTYLNVLQLNDEVLVPVYNEDDTWEGVALDLWDSVMDGRYRGGVVPVPADDLIAWHGSLHCITRTVPVGTLPNGWVAQQLSEQRLRWSTAAFL